MCASASYTGTVPFDAYGSSVTSGAPMTHSYLETVAMLIELREGPLIRDLMRLV